MFFPGHSLLSLTQQLSQQFWSVYEVAFPTFRLFSTKFYIVKPYFRVALYCFPVLAFISRFILNENDTTTTHCICNIISILGIVFHTFEITYLTTNHKISYNIINFPYFQVPSFCYNIVMIQ